MIVRKEMTFFDVYKIDVCRSDCKLHDVST
jgi:hypothetical protein